MAKDKNVFNEIVPNEKLPASAKADVMDRIETAKLMLNFWDLFAQKRVEVNLNALGNNHQNKKLK